MKKLVFLTILSGLAVTVNAEPADFSKADANGDGVLSTKEAKMALPDIIIVDNNNDGMLNPSEAEVAVPGLNLSTERSKKSTAQIGEKEYADIIEAVKSLDAKEDDRS